MQDVVNHVLYEDLCDIVLVGYSYGGAVVTACLDHIHDRVRDLVYLDAFVPADGQSLADLLELPKFPMNLGQDEYLPALPRAFDDPAEEAFQKDRAVPHPLATGFEPVALHKALEDFPFRRTHVKATANDPDEFGEPCFLSAAEHARTSEHWQYREVDSNHMLLSNRPKEVVALLLDLA